MAIKITDGDIVCDGTVCNASDQTAEQKVFAEIDNVFAEIEAGNLVEERLDLDYLDALIDAELARAACVK
jgi:hypothetical protein